MFPLFLYIMKFMCFVMGKHNFIMYKTTVGVHILLLTYIHITDIHCYAEL